MTHLPDPTNLMALQAEQAASVMQNVFSSLVQNQLRQRLPERIFVERFLPYFSGKVNIASTSSPIAEWISIAGSPTSEVELIDGTGKVVATVPAVFHTGFINPRKSEETLSRIAQQHELEKTNPINNSDNKFAQRILSKVPQATVAVSEEQKWETLFKRYGVGLENKKEVKTESSITSGSSEELDFGDL